MFTHSKVLSNIQGTRASLLYLGLVKPRARGRASEGAAPHFQIKRLRRGGVPGLGPGWICTSWKPQQKCTKVSFFGFIHIEKDSLCSVAQRP